MKLTLGQRIYINHEIDQMFEAVKARMQGRFFKGASIFFTVIKDTPKEDTIEGMYNYVLNHLFGAGKQANEEVVSSLADIFGNYVEAQKLKVKNHILADIATAKNKKEAFKAVDNHIDKSTKYLNMLVATESKTVKAYANREGISMLAGDLGVKDPTIVFFGKVDAKLCKYCKEMYHDQENLWNPRPWKMSELRDGYFKPKEWDEKSVFHSAHPNCRHTMSFVPPHYGFDNGRITFKGFRYDYYEDYHGMKKSEELEKGLKGDWQKEGYTLKIGHMQWGARNYPGDGEVHDTKKHDFYITAHDRDGKEVAFAAYTHGPGPDGESFHSTGVDVEPEHRRKGLASAMHQMAEKLSLKTLNPAKNQSPSGESLWRFQPNRPFGKSEELQALEPAEFFMDYDEFLKNYDNLHLHEHED